MLLPASLRAVAMLPAALAHLLVIAPLVANMLARADDENSVTMSAHDNVPSWATASSLQFRLGTAPGQYIAQQYVVIPLTQNLGLNESDVSRGAIDIHGQLRVVDDSDYLDVSGSEQIAFLSCDKTSSLIQPDRMLHSLMDQHLQAIILYTTAQNWCALDHVGDLGYTSLLSMVDSADAAKVYSYFNGTNNTDKVFASITGDAKEAATDPETGSGGGKGSSSVAMSVLYSITALITLLFLVIIATGAVRAHRNPERYGPRRGAGGRSRQSRAKGLARAIVDTLPVVKFGNQEERKPDPELELETGTVDGHDDTEQRDAAHRDATPHAGDSAADMTPAVASADRANDATPGSNRTSAEIEPTKADGTHLGCSICTEDFKMGEDVRVLPCNHQFHPPCVDPWLLDVSGTCPLCRYDLHPQVSNTQAGPSAEGATDALPPPLAVEGIAGHETPQGLESSRLRQAPHEEQMRTLRRLRADGNADDHIREENADQRGQGARFAAKLRDKFRIRTRAQASGGDR